jgi:pimeloyl-ACP methyl ester carboxylesterase
MEQLAEFRAVPIDLLGHGTRRRWDGAGPLSLCEEAAAISASAPDDAPFHLIGHSYGGAVALRFALSFPERLRSLTLIEPSCFHILKDDAAAGHLLQEIRDVAEAVNRGVICGDYRAGMATFIDYWCGAGNWQDLHEVKKSRLAQLSVQVAHHFWSLIEEKTALAAYAGIEVPTLILCGTRAPRPSRAIARILADTLPRAWHRTIRNAGHMSAITHPAEVGALILRHLRANAAPAGTGRIITMSDLPPAARDAGKYL